MGKNAGDGATARPWKLDNDAPGQDAQLSSVWGADGTLVIAGEGDGWMVPFACSENGKANARLVIEAVNAHSPLLLRVKALEEENTRLKACLGWFVLWVDNGRLELPPSVPTDFIEKARLALASKAVAK